MIAPVLTLTFDTLLASVTVSVGLAAFAAALLPALSFDTLLSPFAVPVALAAFATAALLPALPFDTLLSPFTVPVGLAAFATATLVLALSLDTLLSPFTVSVRPATFVTTATATATVGSTEALVIADEVQLTRAGAVIVGLAGRDATVALLPGFHTATHIRSTVVADAVLIALTGGWTAAAPTATLPGDALAVIAAFIGFTFSIIFTGRSAAPTIALTDTVAPLTAIVRTSAFTGAAVVTGTSDRLARSTTRAAGADAA